MGKKREREQLKRLIELKRNAKRRKQNKPINEGVPPTNRKDEHLNTGKEKESDKLLRKGGFEKNTEGAGKCSSNQLQSEGFTQTIKTEEESESLLLDEKQLQKKKKKTKRKYHKVINKSEVNESNQLHCEHLTETNLNTEESGCSFTEEYSLKKKEKRETKKTDRRVIKDNDSVQQSVNDELHSVKLYTSFNVDEAKTVDDENKVSTENENIHSTKQMRKNGNRFEAYKKDTVQEDETSGHFFKENTDTNEGVPHTNRKDEHLNTWKEKEMDKLLRKGGFKNYTEGAGKCSSNQLHSEGFTQTVKTEEESESLLPDEKQLQKKKKKTKRKHHNVINKSEENESNQLHCEDLAETTLNADESCCSFTERNPLKKKKEKKEKKKKHHRVIKDNDSVQQSVTDKQGGEKLYTSFNVDKAKTVDDETKVSTENENIHSTKQTRKNGKRFEAYKKDTVQEDETSRHLIEENTDTNEGVPPTNTTEEECESLFTDENQIKKKKKTKKKHHKVINKSELNNNNHSQCDGLTETSLKGEDSGRSFTEENPLKKKKKKKEKKKKDHRVIKDNDSVQQSVSDKQGGEKLYKSFNVDKAKTDADEKMLNTENQNVCNRKKTQTKLKRSKKQQNDTMHENETRERLSKVNHDESEAVQSSVTSEEDLHSRNKIKAEKLKRRKNFEKETESEVKGRKKSKSEYISETICTEDESDNTDTRKEPLQKTDNSCTSNYKTRAEKATMNKHTTSSEKFQFLLNKEDWNNIKPNIRQYLGKRKRNVRRLQNNWTDIFSEKIGLTHPGCVIAFKSHHCKTPASRRLSGAYVTATAFCKGVNCSGKFVFTIENEYSDEEDIPVYYSVTGHIEHDVEEVNRRNVTGLNRNQIGRKIQNSTAASTYYDQLLQGNRDQMSHGNFTSVPNPTVLRKIVSEIVRKEYLHENIMSELEMLKENFEKEYDPYIRDIGLDPFTLILFSDVQIQKIKTLSTQNKLNLYIDATGSVISRIANQKQPYLYSIIVKPESNLPGVSVADMVTTQHSIPRIELFLNTVKRAASLSGTRIKIQKVETDYSFALIQASMRSFNNLSIKSYIMKCFEIINSKNMDTQLTVHHLCSAHMLQDFIRQLKTIKSTMKKAVRELLLSSFALLQNVSSMQEAVNVYTNICYVFLSSDVNSYVTESLESLKKKLKRQGIEEDGEEEDQVYDKEELLAEDDNVQRQTIREASPFTKIFRDITTKVEADCTSHGHVLSSNSKNEFYFPQAVQCLMEKFMHMLPLWSGIMLTTLTEPMTRDTNSPVEDWFKVIKNDIGLKSRSRPSKFVINLRQLINGRLMEFSFPNARKKKTSGKRKLTEEDINSKEEFWAKRSGKKKPRYMPKMKTVPQPTTKNTDKPTVMSWGGALKGHHLDNTCTIDNGLTIMHLYSMQNPSFVERLEERNECIWGTLLTVFKLMTDCLFTQAKLVWINYTRKVVLTPVVNLYGDESDMFFTHMDREWISRTESTCIPSCPAPLITSKDSRCVITNAREPFRNLQTLIDIWLTDTETCTRTNSSDDDEYENDETRVCPGLRRIRRRIIRHSPVLMLRLYEHCLQDRITTEQVLDSKEIQLENSTYALAGITLFRDLHYCAIVYYNGNTYWYDGLRGELDKVPDDIETWFPCHAVFCQT